MGRHQINSQTLQLCVCLPFVEIGHEAVIELGPVVFWPATKVHDFLSEDHRILVQDYLHSVGQVKVRKKEKKSF